MMKTKLFIAASVLFAASASATPLSGTDGSGNPPVPGATATVDFEGQGNQTAASFTLGGVTISGIGGDLRIDNSYAGQYNGRGGYYLDNNMGDTNEIRFDFGGTVSAFAFNFGASDVLWTLSAFDSSNNLIESVSAPITHASNAGDYIGLADAGIAYATLTASEGGDWVFVENITVAGQGTNNVPEPATLALCGLGLAAIARSRRKSKA
jgi:hypothetical protein